MRVKSKKVDLAEGDLTPMIDMVFQLIAFFMVLINFAQTESNDRVKLPSSQLVKPPEVPLEFPIILHIAQDGEIIWAVMTTPPKRFVSACKRNRGHQGRRQIGRRCQRRDPSPQGLPPPVTSRKSSAWPKNRSSSTLPFA